VPNIPVVGQIYTIREIFPDGPWIALMFEEVVNPEVICSRHDGRLDFGEIGFNPDYFRPVRSTSLDVFTQVLEPV
jgi:hypothetical protein